MSWLSAPIGCPHVQTLLQVALTILWKPLLLPRGGCLRDPACLSSCIGRALLSWMPSCSNSSTSFLDHPMKTLVVAKRWLLEGPCLLVLMYWKGPAFMDALMIKLFLPWSSYETLVVAKRWLLLACPYGAIALRQSAKNGSCQEVVHQHD